MKLQNIRKRVLIIAPVEKVWKAISTAEGIASWWKPNTFKPVIGHEFTIRGGEFGDLPCKVTKISSLKNRFGQVCFDWGKDWHLAFIVIRFNAVTEFKLVHSGWDTEKVTEFGQPHSLVYELMNNNWEKVVEQKLPSMM
ncbi:SRPBCC family protein [Gordoniibacillus kamchatkensis]|nr:SRPBCC domain-containing protein [Paenibacillus sp. VKM B-2647]